MGADETYEFCDCDWFEMQEPTAVCGCGERHARLYRDRVIHWRGGHWVLWCAFQQAVKELNTRAGGRADESA